MNAHRAGATILLAGLVALSSSPAGAQRGGIRLPVVRGDAARDLALRGPPGSPDRIRRVQLLPFDHDARMLARRPRRRSPPGRSRSLLTIPFFVVPRLAHEAAGHLRRPAAAPEDAPPSRRLDPAPAESPSHPPVDTGRSRPEPRCFQLFVRLVAGGTHRLRIDGAALGAHSPAEVERTLRSRMDARGTLQVRGLDGVSLHLASGRVRAVSADRCRSVVVQ